MPVDFDDIFGDVQANVKREQDEVQVCLLIDDSGSMNCQAAEVRKGLKKMQEQLAGFADKVSIRTFTQKNLPFDRMADYRPDYGDTPLYSTLKSMVDEQTNKAARCIMVVVTDGQDNSSANGVQEQLKRMIPQLEAEKGWHFLWAANTGYGNLESARNINVKPGKTMAVETAGNAYDALVKIGDTIASHIQSGDVYQQDFFGT